MLKTISAALLAVFVFAAPALAASPVTKTTHAPIIKSVRTKSSALDANARMGRHHHYWHHRHYRHHRFHKR